MFFDNADVAYRIEDVRMRYCGKPEDRSVTEQAFADLVYFIRADETVYLTENETFNLHHGSLLYLPAGSSYRHIRKKAEKNVLVRLRVFGTDDIAPTCFEPEKARKFDPLFRKLAAEWDNGFSGFRNACHALLYTVFEQLTRLCEEDRHRKQSMLIEPGVRYLRENVSSPELSVAKAAEVCHISEVYFREIYRLVYGISPHKDVTEARIRRACDYLMEGNRRISEVADLCGFSDVKYFSRLFRSVMKVAPRDYMKM